MPVHAENRSTRSRHALVVALVLAAMAGCGGSASEAGDVTPPSAPAADTGAIHVHGLGYDEPRDVLYVATHTGLFELLPQADRARRIGDSRQDTMGFTLVTPRLLLGSGHPDLREDLPPHLGLLASRDRGRSWQSVSLLGEADFHVLRAQGETVYGLDSQSGDLLVSVDSGRTWARSVVPEAFIDLVIDPEDVRHLLASGGAALYESRDAGRTWSAVATGLAGYLAWPTAGRLLLVDAAGSLLSAPRPGGPWRTRAQLGSPPAALLAVDDRRLFVALHDGTIRQSSDGGATWAVRARP